MGRFTTEIHKSTVEEELVKSLQFSAPSGTYTARVDKQGRLTIPAAWVDHLRRVANDLQVFVTSVNLQEIKIYPAALWRHNLQFAFEHMSEEEFDDWNITVQHYGLTSTIDPDGRVVIKPALREAMQLNDKSLTMLNSGRGVLKCFRTDDYNAIQPGATQRTTQPDPQKPRIRML